MAAYERSFHAPPTWWLIAAFLIGGAALFVFGSIIIKAVTMSVRNAQSLLLERRAVVVARRQEVWGESARTQHYITFQFPDGARAEFALQGEEYGLIADGDAGLLRSQGTKFLGFDRSHHGGEADA